MEEKICPCCHSRSELIPAASILLSFEDWPTMLAACCTIAVAGSLLSLDILVTGFCSVLAALPIGARYLRKLECERCGIQIKIQ